jgi:hypothetical protein
MNTATQHQSPNLQVVPFSPHSDEERQVSRIVRMMIHYWTLRTMIERARRDGEDVNPLWVGYAKSIRVQGFRDEYNSEISLAQGQPVFDDEKVRQAGTRIAYLLPTVRANFAVGEVDRAVELLNQALTIEEEIVTFEVNRALYGIDLEQVRIAA